MQEIVNRAKELLADGTVKRVLGWKAGDLPYNPEPAYFEKEEDLEEFVYNGFCGANLSKYMIEASKMEGKTLVCLKPCDTYSYQQLMKEHRVDREKAYIIGVGCKGKLDIERIRKMGIKGIKSIAGANLEDEAETLTIETLYGEKEVPYKDAMLDFIGVENGRTRVEWVSAAEGVKFSQTMHEFVDKITSLGKNVRLEDLRCRKS